MLMTGAVIVVAIYDLLVVTLTGSIDYSVSRWFASYATYPGIVFGVGYVCGHFFGWMTPTMPAHKKNQLLRIASHMRLWARCGSYFHEDLLRWAVQLEEIAGK